MYIFNYKLVMDGFIELLNVYGLVIYLILEV